MSKKVITVSYTHLDVYKRQGMFPIDSKTRDYDAAMLDKFAALDKVKEYPWDIRDILPKAVSYTHLDVYKRQGWYPADWFDNCDKGNHLKAEPCTGRFHSGKHGNGPVSYTHLECMMR